MNESNRRQRGEALTTPKDIPTSIVCMKRTCRASLVTSSRLVFHACVPCLCPMLVFHACVPCLCSMLVFHACVPCLCSMLVFHAWAWAQMLRPARRSDEQHVVSLSQGGSETLFEAISRTACMCCCSNHLPPAVDCYTWYM